jgi:hypothetical protein
MERGVNSPCDPERVESFAQAIRHLGVSAVRAEGVALKWQAQIAKGINVEDNQARLAALEVVLGEHAQLRKDPVRWLEQQFESGAEDGTE